jgi:DNA-binding PadR family transcriptional regulator
MPGTRRPSSQATKVLLALAAKPAQWRYGYDLATEVHLKSGSLYPILVRLADRGLLETSWQAGPEGRPPRHLYRLTSAGQAYVSKLAAASAVRTTARHRIGLSEA